LILYARALVEEGQRTNEAFQMIKTGNETRESYEIDVEMPDFNATAEETGRAVDGALGRNTTETATNGEAIYKTCMKSGESYTKPCRRQRMVEIRIIPEVKANHPRTCPGHMVSRGGTWGVETMVDIALFGNRKIFVIPGARAAILM